MSPLARIIASVLPGAFVLGTSAQNLTVQIGTPPPPPVTVVSHDDTWSYRRGTNAPQVDWRTAPDTGLDATWVFGPGGFGYGDTAIQGQATTINNMRSVHSTLYIRREFQVTNSFNATAELRLRVDFDDGFVAYLDGVELTRANISGAAGSPVAPNSFASGSHEASCCNAPLNPPQTFVLGPVGNRLAAGTHVLSLIALNDDIASSDLHIIPDLIVAEAQGGNVTDNGLYVLAATNTLVLTGSNTMAGSTRVTVNADDATFNAGTKTWSKIQSLTPGFNRLYIAAHDNAGTVLTNLIQDVVYEVNALHVGGTISASTFWTNRNEVIHVTNNVSVANGATLEIGLDAVILLSPAVSITALTNSAITSIGNELTRAYFLPASSAAWGGLTANGTNSSLTIRNADVVSGQVRLLNGGTMLLEDMTIRDLPDLGREVIEAVNGAGLTMRRVYMTRFAEGDSQNTPVLVEDSLLEGFLVDGLDIKATNSPLVVRRTTLRNADPNNSNADGIDFGPGAGTVENCLIHDFPDKGVSIGGAPGTVIRDSLIYKCGIGISAYSSSNCLFYNTTVAACSNGVFLRNNPDPALASATNLIVWRNSHNIIVTNTSALDIRFSDVEGTNFPGVGNISADPLFASIALDDYRLAAGSPCIGTGQGGVNMGVPFPVGGIPAMPLRLGAYGPPVVPGDPDASGFVQLSWQDDADNEDGFMIERSTNRITWEVIENNLSPNINAYTDPNTVEDVFYYYRVRATNSSGVSFWSNLGGAIRRTPLATNFVGGTISSDTIWTGGSTIVVTSSVTVAAGVTLTIEPCARVLFNQGLSLTVNGVLLAEGTPECHIVFTRNAGATSWSTIDLFGSANTHRLVYVDVEYSTGNIDATGTAIYLQNVWWTNTTAQLLDMVNTSVTLLDSYIPGGFGNEPIHFSNMPGNGYALFKGNVFGAPQGYNDSVDFTGGNRPGPIVQFIDNVFLAAVDDCFDMDGTDAHIEGNIFMNVHQDAVRASTANAVAAGADGGNLSELVVVRNIFYDCDHALLLKDFGSCVFENNTVVTVQTNQFAASRAAYVQFGEPHRGDPGGRGILMNGNILWDLHSDTPFIVFTNGTMFLVANDNIIQGTNMMFGGNSTNDPMFVNWQTGITHLNIRSNLALLPGSPAIGTGPNGLDRGALVPGGASISGEPNGTTTNTSATLTVAGPGIYAYRWKLNDGPWSAEVPLTNNFLITATMFSNAAPITLSSLSDGTYTVYVIGKNSAGAWQETNNATASGTWVVNTVGGDSDGDGMPDAWEQQFGLIVGANDSGEDGDGDTMTNLEEYLAGTDPTLASSRLAMVISPPVGGAVTLQFDAVSNKSYSVLYRTSLSTGAWTLLQNYPAVLTNRLIVLATNVTDPARFFQVVTPQGP